MKLVKHIQPDDHHAHPIRPTKKILSFPVTRPTHAKNPRLKKFFEASWTKHTFQVIFFPNLQLPSFPVLISFCWQFCIFSLSWYRKCETRHVTFSGGANFIINTENHIMKSHKIFSVKKNYFSYQPTLEISKKSLETTIFFC